MQLGMEHEYRRWLVDHGIPEVEPAEGRRKSGLSKQPYVPDPLDLEDRDQLGMDTVPDRMSITSRQALETLEALDRLGQSYTSGGTPFSLHVSFHMPHSPFIVTKRYHDMYDPERMPLPPAWDDTMTESAYKKLRHEEGSPLLNETNVRRWTASYYGAVSEIDEWVGMILSKLDVLGIAGETLVVFASDHGEMLGSHGTAGKNLFL